MCPHTHTHAHVYLRVEGVGHQEMSRARECCAGKTVWEKPATPPHLPYTGLPVSGLVRRDFRAAAPGGYIHTHTIFRLVGPVWPLVKSIRLHQRKANIGDMIINSWRTVSWHSFIPVLLSTHHHLVDERGIKEKLCDYFNGLIVKAC